MGFVERGDNLLLLGPPGTCKTMLAVALRIKAVDAGHRVLFLTLETLITRLRRAQTENRCRRNAPAPVNDSGNGSGGTGVISQLIVKVTPLPPIRPYLYCIISGYAEQTLIKALLPKRATTLSDKRSSSLATIVKVARTLNVQVVELVIGERRHSKEAE